MGILLLQLIVFVFSQKISHYNINVTGAQYITSITANNNHAFK